MSSVSAVLSRAGIRVSEEGFARLLDEAFTEIGRAGADQPATLLTTDEAAALTAVKADLSPRRPRETDPRTAAAASYAALLADSLPVAAAARQLGIDASRVRHRLARHQLIGIRRSTGWLLPAYQFGSDGRPLPGLERVAAAFAPGTHPVVVARFFASQQPELRLGDRPATPRQWLESGGDPATVVGLARALDLAA